MAPTDRSAWRNTYIYSSNDRTTVIGGLWTATAMTNANHYSMLEIFYIFTNTFVLHDESEQFVERDGQQLQLGKYYIVTNGSFAVTDEVPLTRTTSFSLGTRVDALRDAVRDRDQACIIIGMRATLASYGYWFGFEATHIFPLAHEAHWNDCDYGSWITIPPTHKSSLPDNYKVVWFTPDCLSYPNSSPPLDRTFLDNPLRPVDDALRWHFRQAVLVNMKGAGEPCFETDFPPGSDMMGEIMSGPKAAKRMEFELFSRFNAIGNCS
ncbi:hypothetical protein HOY82DRAFT_631065 [Tuber indicum]|nr:hypothetical protein HOY82DRAFT_631065 [Tuber indicum]